MRSSGVVTGVDWRGLWWGVCGCGQGKVTVPVEGAFARLRAAAARPLSAPGAYERFARWADSSVCSGLSYIRRADNQPLPQHLLRLPTWTRTCSTHGMSVKSYDRASTHAHNAVGQCMSYTCPRPDPVQVLRSPYLDSGVLNTALARYCRFLATARRAELIAAAPSGSSGGVPPPSPQVPMYDIE